VVPTRIAIVLQTPKDPHSSVFITYQALADEIARRGSSASIFTPQDFPSTFSGSGRLTPVLYPLTIARWMRRARASFDVVVFHSYAGWLATASRFVGTVPAVVAFHGIEPMYHAALAREAAAGGGLSRRYRFLQERLMPFFLRTACRGAALVTCLNAAERDYIVGQGWADRARVATVAHGVQDAFYLATREARPVRTLLFVAQWLPMKGTEPLRAAFTTLARRHATLRLTCAGTLASADTVSAAFPEDVRPRVVVMPRVDRAALASLYRDADIFVFPSNYEGFGVALVEAMAARLPIVTTAVGVAADALADGDSALVVRKRDPDAIVTAIERLIADDALRSRLGAAAAAVAARYREADRVREWVDVILSELRTKN
jgi:glycosyltransferase involved in cell wall biosynthesis